MLKGLSDAKQVQQLRDQVNIRRYVDGIAQPIPVRVGGWLSGKLSEAELRQLKTHVERMVKDEKYSKPPQIAAPALQAQPRS